MHHGESVKTYLSAWIDCHSRYIVEARYYVRENLDILVDSLLRAWGNHGASRELYVDNARIYHANALQLACTQLNIQLLHRPPRDPPAGGLIERFFQTCQTQLEAEVRAAVLTLDELNRVLAAWLQTAYHQEVHSQTGQTPHAALPPGAASGAAGRPGRRARLLSQAGVRTVNEDFSDVRLDNLLLRGRSDAPWRRVIVEYDPFSSLEEVLLYSLTGAYLGRGKRYQREKGSHPQPPPAPPAGPITPHYLDALRAEHAAAQQQRRSQGIDFHSARQRNVWSVTSFARVFARFLGRQGGVSGLTARKWTSWPPFTPVTTASTKACCEKPLPKRLPPRFPKSCFNSNPCLKKGTTDVSGTLPTRQPTLCRTCRRRRPWQDPRMDEGLARLEYLVQCGQLGLVTGPSGVGKSAL